MTTGSEWMVEGIASIPTRSEVTFAQLWDDKRLEYQDGAKSGDKIDRANARLASSTLERRLQLLIVLPDDLHQRAPLLFGGTLISQWWDRRSQGLPAGKVIYFGTTIGIREHLSRVRIGRLQLSDVFPQSKANSGDASPQKFKNVVSPDSSALSEVVCAYSPSDPSALLDAYRPVWIAIDCGNEGNIRWLPQLLAHAQRQEIPVIAWSHNPLSEVTRHFEETGHGQVIRWPFSLPADSDLTINPITVETADDDLLKSLQGAYRSLAKATAANTKGRLVNDALGVTWRIQRQLEQLSVPLDLFESETNNYWGVQPIRRLFAGAQRFISELGPTNRSIAEYLSDALLFHEQVIDIFHDSGPPIWNALNQLCIEDLATDGKRLIVFSSKARKQMFSLALLSRYNLSEDDLVEIGVSLSSLTEIKKASTNFLDNVGSSSSALLASLPSTRLSTSMTPLMSLQALDVLVLPFQIGSFSRWVEYLKTALITSPATAKDVIEARAGRAPSHTMPQDSSPLTLGSGRRVLIETGQVLNTKGKRPSLPALDVSTEIGWYMDDADEQEPVHESVGDSQTQHAEVWTSEAIKISLTGGWHGFFSSDDKLNVVLEYGTERRTDERFVRSLRVGDRILVVHGQRRQSIYDLVISRVHNHPAMEIHLALISKWQEELAESFRARQMGGWTAEDVLSNIQEQGSQITSVQTIRLWISGQVLAPEDPTDLLRLANSMDMRFVKQYHSRISTAAKRIRGLHISLSNRLNRWLKEQVTNTTASDFEIFDDELDLSFQDFRDSLEIHTVESVGLASGLFLRDNLGSFEQEEYQT